MEDLFGHLKKAGCVVKVLLIASSGQRDAMGEEKLGVGVLDELRDILRSELYIIQEDD